MNRAIIASWFSHFLGFAAFLGAFDDDNDRRAYRELGRAASENAMELELV
jgi:uncharacterized protein YcbX